MSLISWTATFKNDKGILLKNAAISVYLAGTTSAARVFDSNENLHDTAPQAYTGVGGQTTIQIDTDDYFSSQLFDVTVTTNSTCQSTASSINLSSIMLMDDAENSRYFARESGATNGATAGANLKNEADEVIGNSDILNNLQAWSELNDTPDDIFYKDTDTLDNVSDGVTWSKVRAEYLDDGSILLSKVGGTLDDVDNGETWAKVLATHLDAGKITLSLSEGTLDDIGDGTTYSRVATTSISAGKIVLTSGTGVSGTLPTGFTEADVTADAGKSLFLGKEGAARGAGYHLDGDNDQFSLGTSTDLDIGTGDASFVIAFRNDGNDGASNVLFDVKDGTTKDRQLLYINTSGHVYAGYVDNDNAIVCEGTTDIGADNKFHVAAWTLGRKSATGMKLYLDGDEETYGTQDDPTTQQGNIASTGIKRIGIYYNDTLPFAGDFYRYLQFNLTLTDQEVAKLSNGAPVPFKYIGADNTARGYFPFATDLEGWILNYGSETATWTWDTDHGVLAVTSGGDSAIRPYIRNPNVDNVKALEVGKKYRVAISYTVSSGTCILERIYYDNAFVADVEETLTGTGIYQYDLPVWTGSDDECYLYFDGRNEFNVSINSISFIQIGCVCQLEPENITTTSWIDVSGNDIHGTPSGAIKLGTTVQEALDAAATSQSTADGQIVGYYQNTEPASGMSFGDIWIDTDGATPLDTTCIYRYEDATGGSQGTLDWRAAATDAIGLVYLATAAAQTSADAAQGTADGKVTTFYQDAAPTAEGIGDLWIDTNDGNKLYRWSGATWGEIQDDAIASAQSTADGKIVSFYQDTEPTAEGVGDFWTDTNDKNKLYRWSGAAWVLARDTDIGQAISDASDAQTTANSKKIIYYQSSIPTSNAAGDMWVDTDDGNTTYVAGCEGADAITAGEWEKSGDVTKTIIDAGLVTTGGLESNNWDTDAGTKIDLNGETLKFGGSNVDASGSAAGIFLGLDTTYKAYVGDGSNEHIKYDSTNGVSISTAASAGITLKNGGGISVEAGGDITLTGDNTNAGKIILSSGATYGMEVYMTGDTHYFQIKPNDDSGGEIAFNMGTAQYAFKAFLLYSEGAASLHSAIYGETPWASVKADGTSDWRQASISAHYSTSYEAYVKCYVDSDQQEIRTRGDITTSSDMDYDIATSAVAFDEAYADNWNNEADFYFFDDKDDLEVIKNIRPRLDENGNPTIEQSTGHALIDDSSLPDWMFSKYDKAKSACIDPETKEEVEPARQAGEIKRSGKGNPWISNRVMFSLHSGAIRELNAKIETQESLINQLTDQVKALTERMDALSSKGEA